jgi:rSAM/selenodomain-associated transferase 2
VLGGYFCELNTMKMNISIIIPVLNEEKSIAKLLDYLLEISNPELINEIIVVDGGSQDETTEIVKKYPKVKIVDSPKGRAKQMNFGAKIATSKILYFLHCDTFPPKNFDAKIINKVQNGNFCGCFKMKFDSNHIVLQVSQWFTKFNFQACRGGDQSLFVEKDLFENLNGFDEDLTIYEDNEFISRLYKSSKFTVIQESVTTSARKYTKKGVWNLQFHFLMIHLMHFFGFKNSALHKYYLKNISN